MNRTGPCSSSSTSDTDSDEILECSHEKQRSIGQHKYAISKIQPNSIPSLRENLRQQSIPTLNANLEQVSRLILSVVHEEDKFLVVIKRAIDLQRSGTHPNDKFVPEGVFARLFPATNISLREDQSISTQTEFMQTGLIKSRKSSIIKFNEKEKFSVAYKQFPMRISLYEFDKNKVRLCLGHCFLNIDTKDAFSTTQIISIELHPTIYKAQSAGNKYLNNKN